MHRTDDTKFLLYIEPPASAKSAVPVEDHLTCAIELAMSKAVLGGANYSGGRGEKAWLGTGNRYFWRGWHTTDCGESSDNRDRLLENGMITNSLAPFYVRWYRNALPPSELRKLGELLEFYAPLIYKPKEKKMTNLHDDIENRFKYHRPSGTQPERYEGIRSTARSLAHYIIEMCPASREKGLALTNLEQAVMWANASIARNEPAPEEK